MHMPAGCFFGRLKLLGDLGKRKFAFDTQKKNQPGRFRQLLKGGTNRGRLFADFWASTRFVRERSPIID